MIQIPFPRYFLIGAEDLQQRLDRVDIRVPVGDSADLEAPGASLVKPRERTREEVIVNLACGTVKRKYNTSQWNIVVNLMCEIIDGEIRHYG